jgi:hypothetical protein
MRLVPQMLVLMMTLAPFALANSPTNACCSKQECCQQASCCKDCSGCKDGKCQMKDCKDGKCSGGSIKK